MAQAVGDGPASEESVVSKTLTTYGLAFIPGFVLSGVVACSGTNDVAPPVEAARDAGFVPLAVHRVTHGDDRDANAGEFQSPNAAGMADGAQSSNADATVCVPEAGTDEPDEAFRDTNCDGIDGDASNAVFVSATGSDSAAGTRDAPFKTIGKGIAVASDAAKSVYVCNGEYPENLRIEKRAVRVYGGYDCDNGWKRIPDRASVAPSSGVPLTIFDVADPVVIERLALRAPDAADTDRGASSIAVSTLRSKDVVVRRSLLHAGNGAKGKNGDPAPEPLPPQFLAEIGQPALTTVPCEASSNHELLQGDAACLAIALGARGDVRRCPDGTLILGGFGGNGGNVIVGTTFQPGQSGLPFFGDPTPGRAGKNGAHGEDGASGASFGRIELGNYVASNEGGPGAIGAVGEAGIGGSGGSSASRGDVVISFWVGGGGGQGGYPGCGGSPGQPGTAGGASIALISDSSDVTLDTSLLETSRGGDGGNGSDGTPGQRGGIAGHGIIGTGDPKTYGQPGGDGGNGGRGGAGGPGGGGPSVGLAWTKSQPKLSNVTFVLGTAGRGGITSARIGTDGIVAETYPPVTQGDGGNGGAP